MFKNYFITTIRPNAIVRMTVHKVNAVLSLPGGSKNFEKYLDCSPALPFL
jgi:hypothetical protein